MILHLFIQETALLPNKSFKPLIDRRMKLITKKFLTRSSNKNGRHVEMSPFLG